mmetsp:Transcript_29140/g.67064  ORF Transcript_29140/g.67064 Transcript_29140/m.67064 type:complete len:343 (-) Transcript_29140:21-1049(-)
MAFSGKLDLLLAILGLVAQLSLTSALKVALTESDGSTSKTGEIASDGLAALAGDLSSGCLDHKADQWNAITEESVQVRMGQNRSLSPADNRKPVLWIHLHNFAGTYLCREAAKQQERGPTGQNCLLEQDRCSTQVAHKRIHCNERAGMDNTNSFSMVERDVEDADFCDKLLTGVMLRDPILGAQSTLRNNKVDKHTLMRVLRSGKDTVIGHRGCLPTWDVYQHFDNFATRSLGGGYMAPPGRVTKEHFMKAKSRLSNMDVVLVLEQLQQHFPQLEHTLGWDTSLMTPSEPANSHCGDNLPSWTQEQKQFLTKLNYWDIKLYEYGKSLAAALSQKAIEAAAAL